jgi:hypothetical protein
MSFWEWLREVWSEDRARIWGLLIAFGVGAACMLVLLLLVESFS